MNKVTIKSRLVIDYLLGRGWHLQKRNKNFARITAPKRTEGSESYSLVVPIREEAPITKGVREEL